jgi:hypothetical protein
MELKGQSEEAMDCREKEAISSFRATDENIVNLTELWTWQAHFTVHVQYTATKPQEAKIDTVHTVQKPRTNVAHYALYCRLC